MLNFILSKLFYKKTFDNYSLNYEFKSIKLPNFSPKHILVFTGGNFPKASLVATFFKLKKNLPKPDYIILADSGLDTFEKYSKSIKFSKPDVILGDFDSLKNKKLISKYKCQIEKFDSYKDFSDTELALILANKLKPRFVTLIGGVGGRIDHFLSILDLYNYNIRPNFWLTDLQVLTLLKANQTATIFPKRKNSPISFFRTNFKNLNLKSKNIIKTNGLEWESSCFRNATALSLSNVIKDDFFNKKVPITVFTKEDILIATEFDTKITFSKTT